MTVVEAPQLRHPLDPEPVRSTKAATVLALGIVATVTGFFIGGLIPATIALVMARSARSGMTPAKGYLTGGRLLRAGGRLAWIGLVPAVSALRTPSRIGLPHVAAHASHRPLS